MKCISVMWFAWKCCKASVVSYCVAYISGHRATMSQRHTDEIGCCCLISCMASDILAKRNVYGTTKKTTSQTTRSLRPAYQCFVVQRNEATQWKKPSRIDFSQPVRFNSGNFVDFDTWTLLVLCFILLWCGCVAVLMYLCSFDSVLRLRFLFKYIYGSSKRMCCGSVAGIAVIARGLRGPAARQCVVLAIGLQMALCGVWARDAKYVRW